MEKTNRLPDTETMQKPFDIQAYKVEDDSEWNFLLDFVQESEFTEDVERKQLLSLWTAYCFHKNLDVDTAPYDTRIHAIWHLLQELFGSERVKGEHFDAFDNFMAAYLV